MIVELCGVYKLLVRMKSFSIHLYCDLHVVNGKAIEGIETDGLLYSCNIAVSV